MKQRLYKEFFNLKIRNFKGSSYESLTAELHKQGVSDTTVTDSLLCHIYSNHAKFYDCDLSDDEMVNMFGRTISWQRHMSQECEKIDKKV